MKKKEGMRGSQASMESGVAEMETSFGPVVRGTDGLHRG